jgi:hypothetical protein
MRIFEAIFFYVSIFSKLKPASRISGLLSHEHKQLRTEIPEHRKGHHQEKALVFVGISSELLSLSSLSLYSIASIKQGNLGSNPRHHMNSSHSQGQSPIEFLKSDRGAIAGYSCYESGQIH